MKKYLVLLYNPMNPSEAAIFIEKTERDHSCEFVCADDGYFYFRRIP